MHKQAHLCLTVDTECDGSRRSPRGVGKPRFRNIREGVAEGLQPMLNRHGACGTYFIDWLVLKDHTAMDALLEMPGRVEIAAHHNELPWEKVIELSKVTRNLYKNSKITWRQYTSKKCIKSRSNIKILEETEKFIDKLIELKITPKQL